MQITDLSNDELVAALKSFVGEGHRLVAKVVAYLVEVEERRIHLEQACSSIFDFCRRKLGMSEGEAFRRMNAARLVKRFPSLLPAIATGRIHLSNLVLLRDLFTEDNVEDLVHAVAGKPKREVEELVAMLAPRPDVPSSIRKLSERASKGAAPHQSAPILSILPAVAEGAVAAPSPVTSATSVTSAASVTAAPSSTSVATSALVTPPSQSPVGAPANTSTPKPQLQPLSENRYRVQLTVSETVRDMLEHAKTLMSHSNPSGDLAVVMEHAVALLIEKLEKARFGKTDKPRVRPEGETAADPARMTQEAKREAVTRDGHQCSFVGVDGERCPARTLLQLDHRVPRARGGKGDKHNARVLCAAHNRYAAEQIFGREFMEQRIDLARSSTKSTQSSGDVPSQDGKREPR